MKKEILVGAFLILLGILLIRSYFQNKSLSEEKAKIETDLKFRMTQIVQHQIREAKLQQKYDKMVDEYKLQGDSLAKERATVKIQYVQYKTLTKLDLSTDIKIDSTIHSILKH